MSKWVNLLAAFEVDTGIRSKDLKSRVEEILKEAPTITGSEQDVDTFVNILSGYDLFAQEDECEECEYGENTDGGNSYECHYTGQNCPDAAYQTVAVITVQGDLRDRVAEQTENEISNFVTFLKDNFLDVRGMVLIDDGDKGITYAV